jgi:hypothetical protein
MQNAYASYQLTQLIGRFSRIPILGALVHVSAAGGEAGKTQESAEPKFVSHVLIAPAPVAISALQSVASHPGS